MTTFHARREGSASQRKASASPRTGLYFLNTQRRRLYCLNETGRQLLAEGIPVTAGDLARQPLRTPEGELVSADELPLIAAWRTNEARDATFVLHRPNGPVQHVHWTAAPLTDEVDAVVGVSASLTVSMPEPDWQVMAGLAHDLRTPLQALRLLVPLLEDSQLPAETRELCERIRSAAERGMSVGLDLLEWCRGPTQNGRRVANAWFPLGPFLRGIAAEHRASADSKNIRLHADFHAAEGWEICSDAVRLGRLLANLLSNAIRYTSAGRVQFAAVWRPPSDSLPPALVLRVIDTGVGISAEDQESIFLPFERGKAGKESDSGGSGVGLSVVDRLVEELGLSLDLFSEYGHGSSFEVILLADKLRRVEGERRAEAAPGDAADPG
jgi:signal transduction histidine kinase